MTRKDYRLIADALASARLTPSGKRTLDRDIAIDDVADKLAKSLAADNPAFSRERFLTAAGC